MDSLGVTATRLWETAPYWRYSVVGAGLFSLLFAFHLFNGPSSGGTVDPGRYSPALSSLPATPSDPASDARLADYQAAHDQALKVPAVGERCEKMVAALDTLTPDDSRRGRNPRTSPPALFKALADGESCRGNITISDKHFDVLSGAAAAAQATHTPATVAAAITALHALDAFDQKRARFQASNATLLAVQSLEQEETAGAARIADVVSSVTAYQQDHAAPSARAVAEALDRLKPNDREKLTSQQPAVLQAAIEASTRVNIGKARLKRVSRLLTDAQESPTAAARRTLIDAVTSLDRFDEALASPEETRAVSQARSIARSELWDLARQRLQELDRAKTPENYATVAGLLAALNSLSGDLSGEERSILARVQAAADKLAQSDSHLAALVAAAASWKKDGLSAAAVIGPAVTSIDGQFDRPRFHQAETDAWKTLQDAQSVIQGPDIGLNPKTKSRVTIAVLPAGQDRFDPDVAQRLGKELGGFGFHVVPDKQAAALWASTTVGSRPPSRQDWSDVQAQSIAEADVSVVFSWQYGNIPLLSCDKTGHSRGKDDSGLSAIAVLDAVRQLAACLNDYAAAQPSP